MYCGARWTGKGTLPILAAHILKYELHKVVPEAELDLVGQFKTACERAAANRRQVP